MRQIQNRLSKLEREISQNETVLDLRVREVVRSLTLDEAHFCKWVLDWQIRGRTWNEFNPELEWDCHISTKGHYAYNNNSPITPTREDEKRMVQILRQAERRIFGEG